MVKPQMCKTEAEIRRVLEAHAKELTREGQEIMIARKKEPFPMRYTLRGYEPKDTQGEYADTVWVYREGSDCVMILSPGQITHFEILPTFRMTPGNAMRQMDEMLRAGGVPIAK